MKDLQTVLDALIALTEHACACNEATGEIWGDGVTAISLVKQMMQAEPVNQYRVRHCADWYDGFHDTGDGKHYETRTLYAAPQAVPAWLPIESAPHSADKVLAFSESGNVKIETGHWLVNLLHASKVDGDNCNYTHWMPLPAAPKGAV